MAAYIHATVNGYASIDPAMSHNIAAGSATLSAAERKTLYVGNLDHSVHELLLSSVFAPFGRLVNVKIMRDVNQRFGPYAFIEFEDPASASAALAAMNGIKLLDKELRVSWATSATNANPTNKPSPATGHSIFVGDLSFDIDDQQVYDAFIPFGPIIEAKVIRFEDGRSRGFAFVCYENEADAEQAIVKMDRSFLMNKPIRCNWATKKPVSDFQKASLAPKRYQDVVNEAPPTNCTVYCGGIMEGLTDELIQKLFEDYLPIVMFKVFADKGFAFVKLSSHEVAAKAISELHGREVKNFVARCAWGKENFTMAPVVSKPPDGSVIPTMAPGMAAPHPYWPMPAGYAAPTPDYYNMHQAYAYPTNGAAAYGASPVMMATPPAPCPPTATPGYPYNPAPGGGPIRGAPYRGPPGMHNFRAPYPLPYRPRGHPPPPPPPPPSSGQFYPPPYRPYS